MGSVVIMRRCWRRRSISATASSSGFSRLSSCRSARASVCGPSLWCSTSARSQPPRAYSATRSPRSPSSSPRSSARSDCRSSSVPRAVRDLRRTRDAVVVQVLQLETREAVEHLRGGAADIAVVHHMPGVAVPDVSGLQVQRLAVDELLVVVPDSHRLAAREEVAVADLQDEPLILPRRETAAGRFRAVVEHLCAQAGFTPRVAFELDDLLAAQAFVAAGIAVVAMHGLALTTVPAGVTVRPPAERPAGSRTVEAL